MQSGLLSCFGQKQLTMGEENYGQPDNAKNSHCSCKSGLYVPVHHQRTFLQQGRSIPGSMVYAVAARTRPSWGHELPLPSKQQTSGSLIWSYKQWRLEGGKGVAIISEASGQYSLSVSELVSE